MSEDIVKKCARLKDHNICGPDCDILRSGQCLDFVGKAVAFKKSPVKSVYSIVGTPDYVVVYSGYGIEWGIRNSRFLSIIKLNDREKAEQWCVNWCIKQLTGENLDETGLYHHE